MKGNVREGTRPELRLRQLLRQAGFPGYRLHWKKVPGSPDIAYPGRRIAIFVNGCFWHRCPYCSAEMPKSHGDFWRRKFLRNQERDARKAAELEAAGWRVVTVWECRLRDHAEEAVADLVSILGSASRGGPLVRRRRVSGPA